ncbi:hypothetical protein QAD02_006485 [Eretmocerus hayati]|uniref:Uncharacterized protein n=1 Tax=Eretmocerus hayati TaxID=131215 RepID=A0ACC2N142_9HYME|nr:hypothetical protein QAD02_006485 [Eretmocerus hayati]
MDKEAKRLPFNTKFNPNAARVAYANLIINSSEDMSEFCHLPRFLISSVCICAGLLALTFPETLRKVLPDSVEDARRIGMIEDLTDSDGQRSKNPGVLREKLFSEDWVDAGNGVIVNFTDSNKLSE